VSVDTLTAANNDTWSIIGTVFPIHESADVPFLIAESAKAELVVGQPAMCVATELPPGDIRMWPYPIRSAGW
jgi:hypothetical protein